MAHSLKYGKVTLEHGESVGEDEPVFILRAKDITAPTLIGIYKVLCFDAGSPYEILDKLDAQETAIRDWQAEHGFETKAAD